MVTDIYVNLHEPMHFERSKNYCIQGASGIGKSSLLHFIGGFRTDYVGTILLDRQDIRSFSAEQRAHLYREELAYMFQDLRLFPNLTAYENVQIVNQQTSFRSDRYIRTRFDELGLSDKWSQPAQFLSLGQQQRVAFIRALCQPCAFMLMDEPVSHLDEGNARIIAQILKQEQAERHFGIIVTSLGKTLSIHYDQTLQL